MAQLTDNVLARIGSRPAIRKALLVRVLLISVLTVFAANSYGAVVIEMLAGRHTASTTPLRISLGGHRFLVAKNLVRDGSQRQNGDYVQLNLYMRWPELDGFSYRNRADFNTLNNIIQLSIRVAASHPNQKLLLRLTEPGLRIPSGLELRPFSPGTGFDEEIIVQGKGQAAEPFVARCFSLEMPGALSAPCERHLSFAEGLVLIYRFPAALLDEWRVLDEKILERARGLLLDG